MSLSISPARVPPLRVPPQSPYLPSSATCRAPSLYLRAPSLPPSLTPPLSSLLYVSTTTIIVFPLVGGGAAPLRDGPTHGAKAPRSLTHYAPTSAAAAFLDSRAPLLSILLRASFSFWFFFLTPGWIISRPTRPGSR
jgi:hypothetical protein